MPVARAETRDIRLAMSRPIFGPPVTVGPPAGAVLTAEDGSFRLPDSGRAVHVAADGYAKTDGVRFPVTVFAEGRGPVSFVVPRPR